MSKRVVVEFVCDGCGSTEQVSAVTPVKPGQQKKLYSYPKGWKTSSEDTGIDICPRCVRKANDICTQARSRAK